MTRTRPSPLVSLTLNFCPRYKDRHHGYYLWRIPQTYGFNSQLSLWFSVNVIIKVPHIQAHFCSLVSPTGLFFFQSRLIKVPAVSFCTYKDVGTWGLNLTWHWLSQTVSLLTLSAEASRSAYPLTMLFELKGICFLLLCHIRNRSEYQDDPWIKISISHCSIPVSP